MSRKRKISSTENKANKFSRQDLFAGSRNIKLISRVLYRPVIKLQKKMNQEILNKDNSEFIVYGNNCRIANKEDPQLKDILIISDKELTFKKFCNTQTYNKKSIHWFKKERNELIWQKSSGNLSKLRNFFEENSQNLNYYKPETVFDIEDKIVIIYGSTGLGKSTLLTHLTLNTRKLSQNLRVIYRNLLDYTDEFNSWDKEIDLLDVIKFLYTIGKQQYVTNHYHYTRNNDIFDITESGKIVLKESKKAISNKHEVIELEQFNDYYNKQEIVLMLDGFDDVYLLYNQKIIQLLQILNKSKIRKIWITTNYSSELPNLEDKLGTISYTLMPFTEDDQKKFMMNDVNAKNSKKFSNKLLKCFKDSSNYKYLSVPLYMQMVADIFQNIFEKFYTSGKLDENLQKHVNKLNRFKLYQNYFEANVPNTEYLDHKLLALHSLFNEDDLCVLVDKASVMKDSIRKLKTTGKIVQRFDSKKVKFVHRTFAEYFVALYLWDTFTRSSLMSFENKFLPFLIEKIFVGRRLQICQFFYCNIQEYNNNDFLEIDKKIIQLIEKIINLNIDKYDFSEELSLYMESLKLLFGIVEIFLQNKGTTHFKFNTEMINKDNILNLLRMSAEAGCTRLMDLLLSSKANKQMNYQHELCNCEWSLTPLWLAAQNGHLEALEHLKNHQIFDPKWTDCHEKTLLETILDDHYKLDFDLLLHCVKLELIDISTLFQGSEQLESPLLYCIKHNAPVDLIKTLIQKINIQHFNQFENREGLPAVCEIFEYLLHNYKQELLELVAEVGLDLNAGYYNGQTPLNYILYVFNVTCIACVPNYFAGKYLMSNESYYHPAIENNLLPFYDLVQFLLEHGAIYNLKSDYSDTPINIITRINYLFEIIKKIYREYNFSLQLENIYRYILKKKICKNECYNFQDFHELLEFVKSLNLMPDYMLEYFTICYKEGEAKMKSVLSSSLETLKSYGDQLQIVKDDYNLFHQRILNLHNDQMYKISEAVEEILNEAQKFTQKIALYVENISKINASKNMETINVFSNQEILEIFDLNSSNPNDDIDGFISKIIEANGFNYLNDFLVELKDVGNKNLLKVFEYIMRYSEQSSKIFDTIKTVNEAFVSIKENRISTFKDALKYAKNDNFMKVIICSQDKDHGSILLTAAKYDRLEIFQMLLNDNDINANTQEILFNEKLYRSQPLHDAVFTNRRDDIFNSNLNEIQWYENRRSEIFENSTLKSSNLLLKREIDNLERNKYHSCYCNEPRAMTQQTSTVRPNACLTTLLPESTTDHDHRNFLNLPATRMTIEVS